MTPSTILACVLALALVQDATRLQTQTRDSSALPVPHGNGAIAGVVVVTPPNEQPRPARHASVTLISGNLQFPYLTITDDDGAFEFDGLAGGNYALMAAKPGYVPMFFGARAPGKGQGVPIAVPDGQRVQGVQVALLPGGVITGVVRLPSGRAAVNRQVHVLPVRLEDGSRRVADFPIDPTNLEGATTDDRGEYRAYGLAPGKYVVEVRTADFDPLQNSFKLTTSQDVQWARQPSAVAPAPPPRVAYAPVYFPGTPNLADASIITLNASEERDGVDVMTQLVPVATISGTVLDLDGSPAAGAQISLRGASTGFSDLMMSMMGGTRAGSNGEFVIRDIRPGTYTLNVRARPRTDTPPSGGNPANAGLAVFSIASLLGGGSKPPTLWASMDLTVNGQDIDGATLQLQQGLVISGTLAFDASVTRPKDLTKYRVNLALPPQMNSPVEMAMAMFGGGPSSASVQNDGTFSIAGVTPGTYQVKIAGPEMRFNFTRPDTGLVLKSAMAGGRDVADSLLVVAPRQDSTLVLTLSDRPTELSGTITDRAGRAAPGFPLLVFSADKTYWTTGSRRVQDVRPSTDGAFFIAGLPAGDYYICALTELDRSELGNPEFLESLIPSSLTIHLVDGQHLTQNVALKGG